MGPVVFSTPLLRHGPDQDRPAARLFDRARQLPPVGGECHCRRVGSRLGLADAPRPGLVGCAFRHADEGAELVLSIVPTQVPKSPSFASPQPQAPAARKAPSADQASDCG
jgi:hypothetical protein